jgi:flagellar protein FlaJ
MNYAKILQKFIALIKLIFGNATSAYTFMSMSFRDYFIKFILPTVLYLVLGSSLAFILAPPILFIGVVFTGGFSVLLSVYYPVFKYSKYKGKINAEFPMFLTHITTLSMSNVNRVEVFRESINTDEYEAISDEINKFITQIEYLNSSLEQAAKTRSKETPSNLMADFYEKLSLSVGAGQDLDEFLEKEQQNVMKEYRSDYEYRISLIEFLTESFIGLNVGLMFLLASGSIFPILIPSLNPNLFIGGSLGLYTVMTLLFVVFVNSVSPRDYLWYFSDEINTRKENIVKGLLGGGIIFTISIALGLLLVQPSFPYLLYPVISVLPLFVPAIAIILVERDIARVEGQFDSFIRSLGDLEAQKQTSTRNILKDIKKKDFEVLDKYIQNLYNRLYLVVKSEKSWQYFSAKIGSRLIKTYSNMYHIGRQLGVDTSKLGKIINRNFNTMKELRKKKLTNIKKLKGTVVAVSLAFSFIMLFMSKLIKIVINQAPSDTSGEIDSLFYTDGYNFTIIDGSIYATIIVNGLLISILIRLAERKYIGGFVFYYAIYIVISFLLAFGLQEISIL